MNAVRDGRGPDESLRADGSPELQARMAQSQGAAPPTFLPGCCRALRRRAAAPRRPLWPPMTEAPCGRRAAPTGEGLRAVVHGVRHPLPRGPQRDERAALAAEGEAAAGRPDEPEGHAAERAGRGAERRRRAHLRRGPGGRPVDSRAAEHQERQACAPASTSLARLVQLAAARHFAASHPSRSVPLSPSAFRPRCAGAQ